ncbi:hypothetical protein [uncultured Enterococcus sp.]|uniref:hypothetical protein n=1 Tax=uncultured Enterococcus sp. TaxID=167972 RepID=UPI002AA90167|nr:hypothetical protein [uncultured Enterococcus sp.]
MKKLSGLGVGLLCVLVLTGCGSTDTSGLEKKLDKLEKNISSLNEKINDLEAVDVAAEKEEAAADEADASEKKAQELAKKKAEEEAKNQKLLEGKIKVPDTSRKTQEQVTAEFEAAGLNVKFVATNMDNLAVSGKRIVYKGECDYLNENCGAEKFDSTQVGWEKQGYYANKGDYYHRWLFRPRN